MSEYITGFKTFDGTRQIDYNSLANKNHSAQHASNGEDPITPDAIGAIPSVEKGAANGVATLDASQKLSASQIPTITSDDVGAIPVSEKGVANGLATLGADGKVSSSQMPAAANIPVGLIAMWSGVSTNIPSGWALCDGTNNTPDLRDRFIVGAGKTYSVGVTGGSNTVTLTTEQMPSHNHTATLSLSNLKTSSEGLHRHDFLGNGGIFGSGYGGWNAVISGNGWGSTSYGYSKENGPDYEPYCTTEEGAHTHTISGSGSVTINSTGSGSAHENRPPYYALCFIMFMG